VDLIELPKEPDPTPPKENSPLPLSDPNAPEEYQSSTTTLHVSSELLQDIAKRLPQDRAFRKIYAEITKRYNKSKNNPDDPVTTLHDFRRDPQSKLLFFRDSETEGLCIPKKCFKQVFELTHDNRAHVGVDRVYYFIHRHVYVPRLLQELKTYINACPICFLAKPKHIHPWGSLQPIPHPKKPFTVLCFDFIDGLPVSKQGNDKVLTVTCKATKYVKFIVGKSTYSAEDWANLYYSQVMRIGVTQTLSFQIAILNSYQNSGQPFSHAQRQSWPLLQRIILQLMVNQNVRTRPLTMRHWGKIRSIRLGRAFTIYSSRNQYFYQFFDWRDPILPIIRSRSQVRSRKPRGWFRLP